MFCPVDSQALESYGSNLRLSISKYEVTMKYISSSHIDKARKIVMHTLKLQGLLHLLAHLISRSHQLTPSERSQTKPE